jgi:hypothetical protein
MEDGFLWHLRMHPDISLRSTGLLGACPSALGPYSISSDLFFQDCDYCLIDLCVIDLTVIDLKAADLLSIAQWVEWIGHMARRNGCEPVFVLIPVIEYAARPHPVFDLYEAIIRRYGFPFLDVRDLIRNLTGGDGAAFGALYKDGAHLGNAISRTVAATLMEFFRADSRDEHREVDTTFAFKEFRRLNLAQLAESHVTRVSLKTGLIAFEGIELTAQAPIEIDVGPIEKVHAVMVNAARSFRKVAFDGDERVVKNLHFRPYFPVPLEARLTPIITPLRDRRGKLTLSIAADDAAMDELTMHEYPIEEGAPGSVELSDLLVETGTRVQRYRAKMPHRHRTDLVALYSAGAQL